MEAKEDGLMEEFKDVELREVQERKVIASEEKLFADIVRGEQLNVRGGVLLLK